MKPPEVSDNRIFSFARATRQIRSSPRPSRLLEWLLWAVAVLIATTIGYQLVDAALYQKASREALFVSDLPVSDARQAESPSAAQPPAAGTPLAMLEIPRLDLSVIVSEGTDTPVLRRGAGRWRPGALFGDGGNVTVAGHRDTFFRPLQEIQIGDLIHIRSSSLEETYEVVETLIVDPTDLEVTAPTSEPTLTLVTCYPFRFIGRAPERFVVRATLAQSSPGDSTAATRSGHEPT